MKEIRVNYTTYFVQNLFGLFNFTNKAKALSFLDFDIFECLKILSSNT